MRIAESSSGGGDVSSSQKAAIKRQIRKLEEKRDEILEKLGLKKPSKKQDAGNISGGTWAVASTNSVTQENATTSQNSESGIEVSAVASPAEMTPSSVQDVGNALRGLAQNVASSSDSAGLSEDKEELAAQLQAIEMQIMALRKQINDSSFDVPEVDVEKAAELAASGMMAREAGRATESVAPPPAVEVTPTGNVDGYA